MLTLSALKACLSGFKIFVPDIIEEGNVVFGDEDEVEDDKEYDMTKDNEDNEDSEDSEDIEDSEEEGNEQRSLLGEAEETVQQDKEYVGG